MNHEIARSVTKNTTVMLASQGVTWISSFVLMLFLPRSLGSEEFGKLYLAISLSMMAHMLIDFGGSYFLPKEIARARTQAPSLLINSGGIRVFLWFVALILLLSFSFVAGYPADVKLLILILGIATLWEVAGKTLLKAGFQGFEQMEYPALAAIGERVFVTVVGVTALLLGARAVTVAIIMAASTFLNFCISFGFMKRIVTFLPGFQWHKGLEVLKAGVPYFLWSIFAVVYYRIDAVMMSLMTPSAVVGWYGAAYRFFDVLMFLPSIFSLALFPVMSRLWKNETHSLRHATQRSLEFIITAGLPISLCTFFYAQEAIQLFFGLEQYGQSVRLLQIFAIGLLLVYIDMVLGTTIMASDKQRQWSWVAFAAIPVNIILNYFFIPSTQHLYGNGGIGAALATLVTEFVVMFAALILIPSAVLASLRIAVLIKASLAGLMMAASILMMQQSGIAWMLQAALAMLTYGGVILALKVPEASELDFFRQFFTLRNLKKTLIPEKGAQG